MTRTLVSIGDLCQIVGGGTPTRNIASFYGGPIPWVTPKDMKSWIIDRSEIGITESGLANSTTRLVPAGSVLLVVRSGILKRTLPVGITSVPVAINQDIKALICSDRLSPLYLARFIAESAPQILQSVRATTADNFPIETLKELRIPLVRIAEQRRIAEILDKADALRAKRRATLAQLDSLTQSIFLDMFGDPATNSQNLPTVLLGEVADWMSGGTPPRDRAEYFDGTIPWFSSGELNDMYVTNSKEGISSAAIQATSAKLVAPGSLMLGMYDTAALKASIAGVECSCNQAIAFGEIDNTRLDTVYAYFAITIGRDHYRRLQRGIRQKNLNLSMIRSIRIPAPSLESQERFRGRVNSIVEVRRSAVMSLNQLDALLASLQHRAFRGEL